MAQQAEGLFKQKVKRELERTFKKDCYFLLTQERGRRGVPDIIACLKGRSVYMELKCDGEVLRPLQKLVLARHSAAGGLSLQVTPSSWSDDLELLIAEAELWS